jgi:hypothetical protein
MTSKSGLVFPENRWLVAEPDNVLGRAIMGFDEFKTPVGQWTLDSGLKLEVTAGAFISFDFSDMPAALVERDDMSDQQFQELITAMRTRVQIVNAFALCLHSATAEVENLATDGFRVTHNDLVHFEDLEKGFGGPGVAHIPVIPGLGHPLSMYRSGVCSAEVVAAACDQLDLVLRHSNPSALELVVLLNHALTACQGHDFDLSVVTAWTVCEWLLDLRWREFATERAGEVDLTVNADRRQFWQSRDFSASVIAEILTLAGSIPATLHRQMTDVRRKRNRWIHGGESPTYRDAGQAVELARDFLSLVIGLDLRVAPVVGVSGLGKSSPPRQINDNE